jgi:glyoxylase-like metal-dependent hydrolase (beta-lactamase superfamily II)
MQGDAPGYGLRKILVRQARQGGIGVHDNIIKKAVFMKQQIVGEFSVERVVEHEGPFAALQQIIPQITSGQIDANAHWLKPLFVDADNNAIMSFHSYILKTPHHTILIDACVGNHKPRPARPGWHLQNNGYLQAMARLGVAPESIDFVCCTHMHADHVGWNTQLVNGLWVPTFANAKYVFAKTEYTHWEQAHRTALATGQAVPNHGSFADSVLPVVDAGQAMLVAEDFEFEEGVYLQAARGHTPGNCMLHAHSQGAHAVFSGDILHTPAQLIDLNWSSHFCYDAQASAQTRKDLVHSLSDTSSLLLAAHFSGPVAGRIVSHGDQFRFQGVEA